MLRHEQQSIRMALATVLHHSFKVHTEYGAPRSQNTASRAREGERVTRRSTRPSSGRLLLPRRSSSCTTRKTPSGECGLGRSSTLCRRAGWCGMSWSTGSRRARSFRSLMLLCRRWGIRCLSCSRRSSRRLSWSLCRLSQCPRSLLTLSPQRSEARSLQTAEQLVEVPTDPGYALAGRGAQALYDHHATRARRGPEPGRERTFL